MTREYYLRHPSPLSISCLVCWISVDALDSRKLRYPSRVSSSPRCEWGSWGFWVTFIILSLEDHLDQENDLAVSF